MPLSLMLFLRANRRHIAELMLASLLVNALVLSLPAFSMLVYDKAMGNQVHDTLWAMSIGMALLLGLEMVLRMVRVIAVEHAGARWDTRLDERLMRGVLAAPMSRPLAVGDLLARYRELATTRDVLSAQCLLPLADLPFALLFAVVVYLIAGPLVLIPLGVGTLLVVVGSLFQGVAQWRQHVANQLHSQKITRLVDVLLSRESLTGVGAAHAALEGFKGPSAQGAKASSRARLWSQWAQQSVPVGMTASSVLMLVAGVYQVEARSLSVGGLISCTMLGGRLVAAMCSLAPLLTRWKEFSRAVRALGEAVDLSPTTWATATPWGDGQDSRTAPSSTARATPEPSAFAKEGLRMDELSLRFPAMERLVLSSLNLHLKSGELVAVVGASGSGKTTLLRVLAGQLAHSAGRLGYAGHVIDSEDARRRLASSVTYKPQEPVFLSGTVAEVVAPGQAGASEVSLLQALRSAGLAAALERGELGLSTPVGTNGAGLSGGQRQMLALARALHGAAELVLLDEPTLGLDRQAQERLISELSILKRGRCVVVSTHTTELIQAADRVLVLERGRLVADSTPARLLAPVPAPTPAASSTRETACVPA